MGQLPCRNHEPIGLRTTRSPEAPPTAFAGYSRIMASSTAALRREIEQALPDRPFSIELWDGTAVRATREGPTLSIRSPRAIGHVLRAPGGLGPGRGHVCGDIDADDPRGIISPLGTVDPPPT